MCYQKDLQRSMFDNDPVLQAAWLYYQSGLSQADVADAMGVSRITIGKYLQTAREEGIVHITLDIQRYSRINIALEIKEQFDLNNVLIVPVKNQNISMNREEMALAAGTYLTQVIEDGDMLGIAWGRTIHQMAKNLSPRFVKDFTVLQMLGSVPSQPDFTTVESSSLIASKFSGRCIHLHVPAIVSSSHLANALRQEPIIQANFSALSRCNKALFVVGNVSMENPLIRAGVITEGEMIDYRNKGATGVICGRFYDEGGQPIDTDTDTRILGIDLTQLKKIKQRIFIASGSSNFVATLSALRGGYVTDLITDHPTAKFLLGRGRG